MVKSIKTYLYFIKIRFLISMAYRFEVITTFLVQIILLVANVFFWKAAYANNLPMTASVTLPQMIDYAILAILISVFHSTSVEGNINSNIRKGNVAVDFIKPVSIMGMYFAQDVGRILSNLFQKFIPVLIFASIFFKPPIPYSFSNLIISFISMILGFLILWFICAIFGLFSFWAIDLGPIGGIKFYIIRFLSGSFVPLWFFPQWIQELMRYFPFMYIYQSPIGIYIGKIPANEGLFILLIQSIWVFVLFTLCYMLQKKAFKNVIVQGG